MKKNVMKKFKVVLDSDLVSAIVSVMIALSGVVLSFKW